MKYIYLQKLILDPHGQLHENEPLIHTSQTCNNQTIPSPTKMKEEPKYVKSNYAHWKI